jgi:micrococcal nuclease
MRAMPVLLLLLCCVGLPAAAADTDAEVRAKLLAGADATVKEVVDGDTVVIDPPIAGAKQIRLVGIQAPKLPLGRKNFKPWPKAADSKYALEAMVRGRHVRLHYGGSRLDRHGRHLAHLFLDDGAWVQGNMLKAGMARVYSFADNRAVVAAMLARERGAREHKRGIWALDFYKPRAAEAAPLMRELGTFQLVEGRVQKAAKVKGRVYLNFGANWRDDFTATLAPGVVKLARQEGLDVAGLGGRQVRVRGWLKSRNGPMIEITHPEQIELLAGR